REQAAALIFGIEAKEAIPTTDSCLPVADAGLTQDEVFHHSLLESVKAIADGISAIAKHVHLVSQPLAIPQIAEMARVSVKTVYRWKEDGLLKPLADGARPLLFDAAEVAEFLSRYRRGRRLADAKD